MSETQPLLPDRRGSHVSEQYLAASPPETLCDLQYDNDHPQQWRTAYKYGIVGLLAFSAFIVTFNCISLVPLANQIVADLDGQNGLQSTSYAGILLVTIWELGEAAGPLLIAPLSEVYGRYPVFNCANALFIASVAAGSLSQSTSLLIFARFVTGAATAANVLNPAVIGDMFPADQRGSAMSLVMLTPLMGGAIGPAIAGAVGQTLGWRYVMWMGCGLAVLGEIMFLTLFPETYKPAIISSQYKSLGFDVNKQADLEGNQSDSPPKSPIWKSIKRPATIFASSIVLQILSLYGAVMFSFFYIISTTMPGILQDRYNFPPALIGSSFLSFSVGSLAGIFVNNALLDRIYKRLTKPNSPACPENRLPLTIFGAFTLPFTIILYGFTAQLHLPVSLLLLSVVGMGFTVMLGLVPVMSYVVDAFGIYSASAITAVLITRCLMGTFLPLAAAPLEDKLGYGWGMTVLAVGCLALAPVPVLVMRYGKVWRQRCDYTINA